MSERTYYDGKYTVKARTDGGLEFLRYGEAWPAADDLRFNNLVGAMFREQLDADTEIAALRKALADYVRHTGIGSTLLPDVVPPSTDTMESEIAALKQRVAELERELAVARGVTQADSARLRAAERRVYDDPNLTFGCDAADHMADMVLELRQHNAELERELEAARKVASCLHDFATAHEKWEAALIMDDAAWSGGMAALPTLTETLYAGMMELQRQRAAALVTYDLAVYRATHTKEPRDEK